MGGARGRPVEEEEDGRGLEISIGRGGVVLLVFDEAWGVVKREERGSK